MSTSKSIHICMKVVVNSHVPGDAIRNKKQFDNQQVAPNSSTAAAPLRKPSLHRLEAIHDVECGTTFPGLSKLQGGPFTWPLKIGTHKLLGVMGYDPKQSTVSISIKMWQRLEGPRFMGAPKSRCPWHPWHYSSRVGKHDFNPPSQPRSHETFLSNPVV